MKMREDCVAIIQLSLIEVRIDVLKNNEYKGVRNEKNICNIINLS